MDTQTYLSIKWSTSRGKDTGCRAVTLTDTDTGDTFTAKGPGYDMVGEVLGDWLASTFQPMLREMDTTDVYGARRIGTGPGSVVDIFGGMDNVLRIAQTIHVRIKPVLNRKGNIDGFIISY